MKAIRNLLVLVCVLLASLGAGTPPPPVLACSGIGATLNWIFERTEVVVKAHVVASDDPEANHVIQVEEYVAGGPGPEYLLVSQMVPGMYQGLLEGYYGGGDCITLYRPPPVGEPIYLFLRREPGGYYSTTSGVADYYHFPTADTTYWFYEERELEDDGLAIDDFGWNQAEFLEMIAEWTGDQPVAPMTDTHYPQTTPLRITTSTGSDFLLPVDGGNLLRLSPDSSYLHIDHACTETECTSLSLNQLYRGTVLIDNTIEFQLDDEGFGLNYPGRYGQSAEGHAFLFSPTSDAVAVWVEDRLEIRHLLRGRFGRMQLINEGTLTGLGFEGKVVWSNDGRWLAFSDSTGLWLWDVYIEGATPQLLVSAEDDIVPLAHHFSENGRYLAYEQGETRATIDVVAGGLYPYGRLSPDERHLLVFDEIEGTVELCTTLLFRCEDAGSATQIEWQNNRVFYRTYCTISYECRVYPTIVGPTGFTPRDYDYLEGQPGITFAIEPHTETLAVVRDSTTIVIGDQEYNIAGQLDGAIVSIEWLPSFFYYWP